MRRHEGVVATLALAAALLVVPATTDARRAKSASNVETQVRAWLRDRALETRVTMGAASRYTTSNGVVLRRVCTVVHEDGAVSYIMPMAMNGLAPLVAQPIDLGRCSAVLPAGSSVRIGGVDFDAERIEIGVQLAQGEACMRVRLGADWTDGSALEVLETLSRAFDLGPAYDELHRIDSDYSRLLHAIADARASAGMNDASASTALAAQRDLLAAIEEAGRNRAALGTALGVRLAETEEHSRDAAAVRDAIGGLQRVRAHELQEEVADRLVADAAAQAVILSRLEEPMSVTTDVEDRLRLLDESRITLERRSVSRAELEGLGGSISERDSAQLSDDSNRHDRVAKLLESKRREREARSRSQRFEEQTAMARDLRRRVSSCGASAAEIQACLDRLEPWSATIEARRQVLAEMRSLGDEGAAVGASTLEEDAGALTAARERLGSQANVAATAALDTSFARLETERLALLRAYGVAMDSPDRPARASALADHYVRMIANRDEADRRGATNAGSQATALRGSLASLRQDNPALH